MDEQLKDFFYVEQEQGRLVFEDFPEYNDFLSQSTILFSDGDLPKPVFDLLETANFIAFAHGLKLGLRLKRWSVL